MANSPGKLFSKIVPKKQTRAELYFTAILEENTRFGGLDSVPIIVMYQSHTGNSKHRYMVLTVNSPRFIKYQTIH